MGVARPLLVLPACVPRMQGRLPPGRRAAVLRVAGQTPAPAVAPGSHALVPPGTAGGRPVGPPAAASGAAPADVSPAASSVSHAALPPRGTSPRRGSSCVEACIPWPAGIVNTSEAPGKRPAPKSPFTRPNACVTGANQLNPALPSACPRGRRSPPSGAGVAGTPPLPERSTASTSHRRGASGRPPR
jgi:hypothetical protein